MRKPCTTKIKEAGAQLVKSRRMAEALVKQIAIAYDAVKAASPELKQYGAKEMEFGKGLRLLAEAMVCEGAIGEAHDHFRRMLGVCDIDEPTDDDIIVILGGGGGGR